MSPKTLYVIDGYNVLHALFPSIGRGELAGRRDWLAGQLASLAALRDADVVLVWDAHAAAQPTAERLAGTRVEVCYAAGRLEADVLIARRIAEQPSDTSVVVVSADQEVQRAAAKAGVRRMTPRELATEIASINQRLAQSHETTRIGTRIEDKVDLETWRRLDELRREGS